MIKYDINLIYVYINIICFRGVVHWLLVIHFSSFVNLLIKLVITFVSWAIQVVMNTITFICIVITEMAAVKSITLVIASSHDQFV